MTDSANTRTLSRRSALIEASTGIAPMAIAVSASHAMAPVAASADAELVDMCGRWIKFCRAHDHASDLAMDIEGTDKDRYNLLEAIATRIYDHRMEPLAKAIADRPAASWAGITAKASVLASDQSFVSTGDTNDIYFCLEPLVLSLVKDVVRLGGHVVPMPQSSLSSREV
jgi:hypothetical protein